MGLKKEEGGKALKGPNYLDTKELIPAKKPFQGGGNFWELIQMNLAHK